MNRKQFVESQGATCSNWNWSWSFVNHSKQFVIFGAWDDLSIICSNSWRVNAKGHNSKGFNQSLEHLRLIQEEGYKLYTFPMTSIDVDADIRAIKSFKPILEEKILLQKGDDWSAVKTATSSLLSEEIANPENYPEGSKASVTINAFERNPRARAACIAHHGYICQACKFDFFATYGEHGREYIHVHHIKPLKYVTEEYNVDPINDLVPVCPNCHAMIHRTEPSLTIAELQKLFS